jgi:hypothetical protein
MGAEKLVASSGRSNDSSKVFLNAIHSAQDRLYVFLVYAVGEGLGGILKNLTVGIDHDLIERFVFV